MRWLVVAVAVGIFLAAAMISGAPDDDSFERRVRDIATTLRSERCPSDLRHYYSIQDRLMCYKNKTAPIDAMLRRLFGVPQEELAGILLDM